MFIWCHDNLILNIKSISTWTFAAASAVCICAKFCNSLLVWSTEMETQELTQHINISEKLEKTTKTTNNNMTIAIWTSRITFLHVWNEMCMRFILLSPHGTWYICVIVYTLLCLISLFFSLFTRRFLAISSHFLSLPIPGHFLRDSLNPKIYTLFIPVCKYKYILSVLYDR